MFVTFGSLLMYLILTHEHVTWFDKCVEKLHFKVHDFMRYVFRMCTLSTSYRVCFPIVVKNIVHTLDGDSNTKCTHLGGAHSMVCDFGD